MEISKHSTVDLYHGSLADISSKIEILTFARSCSISVAMVSNMCSLLDLLSNGVVSLQRKHVQCLYTSTVPVVS